jgi:nucleotide-binding universal stress UspA family protein
MGSQLSRVVVVGVDFGRSGDDAILESVLWLAAGWVSTLHAVHVLDPRDVIDDPEQPATQTEQEFMARAPAGLRQRIARLAHESGHVVDMEKICTHARIGKAPAEINQVAIDYDADLLIVGTHGRRGLGRLVLGSVAESLVRTAHCPVLIAKPKDYSGLDKSALPEEEPYPVGDVSREPELADER